MEINLYAIGIGCSVIPAIKLFCKGHKENGLHELIGVVSVIGTYWLVSIVSTFSKG